MAAPPPADRADHLLQGLQGLVLHLHAIQGDLPPGTPLRQALERWLQSADGLVHQGCAVPPGMADGGGQPGAVALLLGLAEMGAAQPALPRPLRLRLRMGAAPRLLQPGVQQALAQLACDHVRHGCLEAGASTASVQLHGLPQGLLLQVRHNGSWPVGTPPPPALRSGAARLGARMRLYRWPGRGHALELQLPAAQAYRPDAASGVATDTSTGTAGARATARPGRPVVRA